MPSVSKAQNRLMHAAAEGKTDKVPKSVAEDFLAADHGRSLGNLPDHKLPKKKLKLKRKHR